MRIESGISSRYCDGYSRRNFLQIGMAGLGSLGLPQLLQAKEESARPGREKRETAVILIWLDGGLSHIDTYDMKPDAPSEYAGIWRPIPTAVPGFEITELFPRQATMTEKFSVVRSLHHDSGDHFTGAHWMLTGRGGVSGAMNAGKYPSIGSIATKVLGPRKEGMAPYVSVPYGMSVGLRPGYFGGNYLGIQYNPFETVSDPNSPGFNVPNLNLSQGLTLDRLDDRRNLQKHFDTLRKDADHTGMMDAMDRFDQQAYQFVTGDAARKAFDISQEDPRLRDRYGRNSLGQSVLLARRLVEAGSTFVTCHSGGWDDHWNLQPKYESRLPEVDAAVSMLFEDLSQRGLYESTLVVLCGEFGRTPRMNDGGNGGPPLSQGTPGRDHWGNACFCLMGGGGVKGGIVVGSTNSRGEVPQDHPLRPGDIHHTIYHVLGIDPSIHFLDHSGRPVPAIDH
ncbi:MAG TPA: DUF1501 domain-containing protein, partial [Planctomycetaceae bacterium]|nr:DUF1501 domain-containing protein [Planctomycetaceae bacterium]